VLGTFKHSPQILRYAKEDTLGLIFGIIKRRNPAFRKQSEPAASKAIEPKHLPKFLLRKQTSSAIASPQAQRVILSVAKDPNLFNHLNFCPVASQTPSDPSLRSGRQGTVGDKASDPQKEYVVLEWSKDPTIRNTPSWHKIWCRKACSLQALTQFSLLSTLGTLKLKLVVHIPKPPISTHVAFGTYFPGFIEGGEIKNLDAVLPCPLLGIDEVLHGILCGGFSTA
jgi:hypothetical protein